MDLSLFFAGTAGSVPTARRGLPAILLRRGGDRILFDCGEGTQRQLVRSVGLPDIGAVFLTHFHADHWLGLPGMLKSFALRDRERPLTVYGPPGPADAHGRAALRLRPPALPVRRRGARPGDWVEFDGYDVAAFNVRHRGQAFGYAIVEDERPGRFDPDRARELGVAFGPGLRPAAARRDRRRRHPRAGRRPSRGRAAASCSRGDTAPCDALRDAAAGADVLVHEATFTESELERARQTGHSTARQAAELAAEAGVGCSR